MFCSSVRFDAAKDIPDLTGKVILVTGGNTGLGKQSVLDYAPHNPGRIWLAARNIEKANKAIQEIKQQVPGVNIEPLEMDLTSFDSIKKAAETVISQSDRLDILMLNAGVMAVPAALTKDGYEIQMGTNHLGHALLTKLLIPLLEKTRSASTNADVRVISVTSYGHTMVSDGFRFDTVKTTAESLGPYGRYYQSKLANVLFARQMAKEYPQITTVSAHPGIVNTELMDRATETPAIIRKTVKMFPWIKTPVNKGAKSQLWASVSKDVHSGEYYEPVGIVGKSTAFGKDPELAKKVWDWTEGELNAYLSKSDPVKYV